MIRETASALIVRDGALLLEARPADAAVSAGRWDTPGGHVRDGEAPAAALARELHEELGITVVRARFLTEQREHDATSQRDYRHHVFLLDAYSGEIRAQELQRLAWIPLADLPSLRDANPLVLAAVDAARDRGWIDDLA